MTVQAIEALNAVDALFFLDKGAAKADLVRLREAICAQFLTNPRCRVVTAPSPPRDADGDYIEGVAAWHGAKADLYAQLIEDELAPGEAGAFLVWGDPCPLRQHASHPRRGG
jgi:precorrin-6A synthase